MRVLVSGSVAYDFLMETSGELAVPTVPTLSPGAAGDATAALSPGAENVGPGAATPLTGGTDAAGEVEGAAFSVVVVADEMRRCLGGCAGNIAYAFHCLGGAPSVVATVGRDFDSYRREWDAVGIDTRHIVVLPDCFTAQAYIVTDKRNNQITLFHPGASARAHCADVAAIDGVDELPLAIVAPNGKDGMVQHCRVLAGRGVPFIFDPGQALSLFSRDELLACMDLCACLIVNDNEWAQLQKLCGLDAAAITARVSAVVVTYGERGSQLLRRGEAVLNIAGVRLGETQNPTGCGDAFRAGLLFGWLRQWSWQTRLQFASVIGGIKAGHAYSQGYALTFDSAAAVYEKNFGALR